jgi:hypothetical protein
MTVFPMAPPYIGSIDVFVITVVVTIFTIDSSLPDIVATIGG